MGYVGESSSCVQSSQMISYKPVVLVDYRERLLRCCWWAHQSTVTQPGIYKSISSHFTRSFLFKLLHFQKLFSSFFFHFFAVKEILSAGNPISAAANSIVSPSSVSTLSNPIYRLSRGTCTISISLVCARKSPIAISSPSSNRYLNGQSSPVQSSPVK